MAEVTNDCVDMNVEPAAASDSNAGILDKLEGVWNGAAEAAKAIYQRLSDGTPTGITDEFGKPLFIESQPSEDIAKIPGLGKPVLDFAPDAMLPSMPGGFDTFKPEPEAIVTEPRKWYDDPNVVSKGENEYHDEVYFLVDGRKVLGNQHFENCTVGVDGRVESMTTMQSVNGEWVKVSREFKYDANSGELTSFTENGANWKRTEEGAFVKEGVTPPEVRSDVSVDPETAVLRYTDASNGDKVSVAFDGRTFTEHADGYSVGTDELGKVTYMGFPPGKEFPEGRKISLQYDSDGNLTNYIENGEMWKRYGPTKFGAIDQFVLLGSQPAKARTVPVIDAANKKFDSHDTKAWVIFHK